MISSRNARTHGVEQRGCLLRATIGAALLSIGWPMAAGAHPATYVYAGLSVAWGTDGNEKDCKLTITVSGQHVAGVAAQRIIVDVIKKDGSLVAGGNAIIDSTYAQGTSGAIDETELFEVDRDDGVYSVKLRIWQNGTAGEPDQVVTRPVPPYCPDVNTVAELNALMNCGNCYVTDDLAESAVQVFKNGAPGTVVLYSLRTDDQSAATFGETVSGMFRAPKCGILKLTVSGTSGPGDTGAVFLEAWNGQGTPAVGGTSYVKKMATGDVYKFSVRASKGPHLPVVLLFDFYAWKDDKPPGTHDDCLMRLKYSPASTDGLTFSFQQIAYKTVPVPRGELPRITGIKHTATVGVTSTEWFEVDIPACGPNGENMTQSFVLPVNGDGRITDGHALGWTKSGSNLIGPDPDGEIYNVAGF